MSPMHRWAHSKQCWEIKRVRSRYFIRQTGEVKVSERQHRKLYWPTENMQYIGEWEMTLSSYFSHYGFVFLFGAEISKDLTSNLASWVSPKWQYVEWTLHSNWCFLNASLLSSWTTRKLLLLLPLAEHTAKMQVYTKKKQKKKKALS